RALHARGLHGARLRDDEADRDAAREVGALREALLVAEAHLVHVAADRAADDLARERAVHVGLAGADVRERARITMTEVAHAVAVAVARAGARAVTDRAEA